MPYIARLWLLPMLMVTTFGQANAQSLPASTVVGIQGACQEVSVAGKQVSCTGHGVMYMTFPNGHALVFVGIDRERSLSFIGEKDSQPRPELYTLYLSRVRIDTEGSHQMIDVAGQCVVQMAKDGRVWSSLDCAASDENDLYYTLVFKPHAKPVMAAHGKD